MFTLHRSPKNKIKIKSVNIIADQNMGLKNRVLYLCWPTLSLQRIPQPPQRERPIIKGLLFAHHICFWSPFVCYFIFLDFFWTPHFKNNNLNTYVIVNSKQIQGTHCQAHPSQAGTHGFPSALRHIQTLQIEWRTGTAVFKAWHKQEI